MADKLKIGESSDPRFEFRTFARDLKETGKLLQGLSKQVPQKFRKRFSEELYIVSPSNNTNNCKIRNGVIDIKYLLGEVDGLEQWAPLMKSEFPVNEKILEEEVFPVFNVEIPKLNKNEHSFEEFRSIIDLHPELKIANVGKERYGYMVHDTICEYARVVIEGIRLDTISAESINPEDVHLTRRKLGLNGMENINYLKAVKHAIGMEDDRFAK